MILIINKTDKSFYFTKKMYGTLPTDYVAIDNYPQPNDVSIFKVNATDDGIEISQTEIEAQAIAHFKGLYLDIFNAKLKELDYDSIATVQAWMSDATFGAEATKIMTWYKALITKNYVILNEAKASGIIPTDEEYLAEISLVH